MRALLCASVFCCTLTVVCSAHARAAVFYHLPSPVGAVSPDGSLALTSGDIWTPQSGLVPFSPSLYVYSRDISNNGVVVGLIDGSYIGARIPIGGPV
jgi:hypothetical protein